MKFNIEKTQGDEYVISRKSRFLFIPLGYEYYSGYYNRFTGYPCWTDRLSLAEKFDTVEVAEAALKKFVIGRYNPGETVTVKEFTL